MPDRSSDSELSFSVFSLSLHRHISVQTNFFFRHRQRSDLQPVLQPQAVNSMMDSGAGGSVVITGSNISLFKSHFHPYLFGSVIRML